MKLLTICLLITGGILLADDWNKRTEVILGQPVIVAGVPVVTLEPGKYVFRLLNSESDRHIVQIFSEREDKLFTTVLAIADYRLEATDKVKMTFYETPFGNPVALHTWFWPGDKWGQEFVYPKGLAEKVARESGEKVLATTAETEPELATAPIVEVTKEGEEQPVETIAAEPAPAAAEPAAEEVAEAAPLPLFVPPAAPLPVTATPLFGIGLTGTLLIGVGIGLKRAIANAH